MNKFPEFTVGFILGGLIMMCITGALCVYYLIEG